MNTRATKQSVASKGSGNKDEDKLRENVMREFVSEYGRGVRQENVRSKTKEITGTLPYALSMRPAAITASNEVDDIVSECQTVNAPNVNRSNSVRVRVLYRSDDVVAVRHNLRREPSPYWLTILPGNVCIEAESGSFVRNKIKIQWLNPTDDPLCYIKGDICDTNSPKCIKSGSRGILHEKDRFHVSLEEDIRLSRVANGDKENESNEQDHIEEIEEEPHPGLVNEELLPPRMAGISNSGRRTTRFVLS